MKKELSERHARALMAIKEIETQIDLMNMSIEKQWNVKQLEEKVNGIINPPEKNGKKDKSRRKVVSKDVRIALNTIKQSLSMVTKSGINIKTEEEDTEEFYQITVRIPKKKS